MDLANSAAAEDQAATDLADRGAAGNQAGWLELQALVGRGWVEAHQGFIVGASGVPAPPFNGVAVYDQFDPAELTDALQRVVASEMPFTLQTRPAVTDIVAPLAEELGLTRGPGQPLMVVTEPPQTPASNALDVRELEPDEGGTHAEIAAEAFDAPIMLMRMLSKPKVISADGVHVLGGDVDGETVATAVADVTGDVAWIYNVATRDSHRRHGFGSAITAATVQTAFDDGASAVFLLATPMGVHVYEELGFRQLEWWSEWTHSWDD